MPRLDTVILDLDGTLVDSVYHHVVAWQRAFLDVGLSFPGTRIHDAIGMGADRLVAHVGGDSAERPSGTRSGPLTRSTSQAWSTT